MTTRYSQLKVKKRKIFGRKVKQLRQKGILPANLYGKRIKSQALEVEEKDFFRVYREVGETGLVELAGINKETRPVLIQNVQKEPVSGNFLHVDFHQVDLKQKITTAVPLEMIGEAPAVAKGGVLVQLVNEIEVEALPTDLPEKLIINVSSLAEINQSLTVADIKYDKKKIELKMDKTGLVVKIEAPAKEEEKVEEKKEEEKPEEERGEEKEIEKKKEGEKKEKGKEEKPDREKESQKA